MQHARGSHRSSCGQLPPWFCLSDDLPFHIINLVRNGNVEFVLDQMATLGFCKNEDSSQTEYCKNLEIATHSIVVMPSTLKDGTFCLDVTANKDVVSLYELCCNDKLSFMQCWRSVVKLYIKIHHYVVPWQLPKIGGSPARVLFMSFIYLLSMLR